MADPEQTTDARLVLLPHRDEQLVRFLLVLLRQLYARLLCFRHRLKRAEEGRRRHSSRLATPPAPSVCEHAKLKVSRIILLKFNKYSYHFKNVKSIGVGDTSLALGVPLLARSLACCVGGVHDSCFQRTPLRFKSFALFSVRSSDTFLTKM
jgi:hypothetical protein